MILSAANTIYNIFYHYFVTTNYISSLIFIRGKLLNNAWLYLCVPMLFVVHILRRLTFECSCVGNIGTESEVPGITTISTPFVLAITCLLVSTAFLAVIFL